MKKNRLLRWVALLVLAALFGVSVIGLAEELAVEDVVVETADGDSFELTLGRPDDREALPGEIEPAILEELIVAEANVAEEGVAAGEEQTAEEESGEAGGESIAIDTAHFPDEVFRNYVASAFDADMDGKLSEAERQAVTQIDVSIDDDEDEYYVEDCVSSLKGIEYFTNLVTLYCENNELGELNVSGCNALEEIYCGWNNISNLNIGGCTKLKSLYCSGNKLSSLDVNDCNDLDALSCYRNKLTSLNVSGCKKLSYLSCEENKLSSLNISGCDALIDLYCNSNKLTSLDVGGYRSLEGLVCYDNKLTSLSVGGCSKLIKLDCDENKLTSLDVSGCSSLERLYCKNNQLSTLDISDCPGLDRITCYGNSISSIDIANCKALIDYVKNGTQTIGVIDGKSVVQFGSEYVAFDIGTLIKTKDKVLYSSLLLNAQITVKNQTYTGKALKPAVKVVLYGKTLKKGKDYTLTYAENKKVGTATVTVTGKGDYAGCVTKAVFKINPKATTGLTLTAGKKKLTVKWKKGKNITGYQIQYGLKSNFAGGKTLTIKKAATTSRTIKSLKAKKYYVRIRAYKKVGKNTYYSKWSKAKSVKVK